MKAHSRKWQQHDFVYLMFWTDPDSRNRKYWLADVAFGKYSKLSNHLPAAGSLELDHIWVEAAVQD